MLSQKLSPEELKKIDIGDINELQIEGNTYYTIKNLMMEIIWLLIIQAKFSL